MKLKPGQGFARRVTLRNLGGFVHFLESADQQQDRKRPPTESRQARTGENLFKGTSIKAPNPFRRSPISRKPKPGVRRKKVESLTQAEVLITEIPRGSYRWNQANFKKTDFTGFFGADDPRRQLRLWNVHEDGSLEDKPEIRPGVSVKSHNFRIELGAAAGLAYPKGGRPIGVFVRTAPRKFLYMLLMPRTVNHKRVKRILAKYATPRRKQLRRARIPIDNVRAEWPESPLWRFTVLKDNT